MTKEMEQEILQYCEAKIDDAKDWLENGREKIKGKPSEKFFAGLMEEYKGKLAGYETVKRVLSQDEDVSVDEAKEMYHFWKEKTASKIDVLRLNVSGFMKQVTDATDRFKLTTVMKDYLAQIDPVALDTEKLENDVTKDDEQQAVDAPAKRNHDIKESAEKYLRTIELAQMGLRVAEKEIKKLFAAMGVGQQEEKPSDGLSLNYEQFMWFNDIPQTESEKMIELMNAGHWLLSWDESEHAFVLKRGIEPIKAGEEEKNEGLRAEGTWPIDCGGGTRR